MNKKNVYLILVFSMLLIFSRCKKEKILTKEGVKRGDSKLNSTQLSMVPYSINDTVVFKDSLENTKAFVVNSSSIHPLRYYGNGGTDVSTDYYDVEMLTVFMSDGSDNSFMLRFQAPLPNYVSNQHINKDYLIIETRLPGSYSSSSFANYLDSTDFYYSLYGASIPHHTAITVLGHTFNDVYELTSISPLSSDEEYIQQLYYSLSDGIVAYTTSIGKQWYVTN